MTNEDMLPYLIRSNMKDAFDVWRLEEGMINYDLMPEYNKIDRSILDDFFGYIATQKEFAGIFPNENFRKLMISKPDFYVNFIEARFPYQNRQLFDWTKVKNEVASTTSSNYREILRGISPMECELYTFQMISFISHIINGRNIFNMPELVAETIESDVETVHSRAAEVIANDKETGRTHDSLIFASIGAPEIDAVGSQLAESYFTFRIERDTKSILEKVDSEPPDFQSYVDQVELLQRIFYIDDNENFTNKRISKYLAEILNKLTRLLIIAEDHRNYYYKNLIAQMIAALSGSNYVPGQSSMGEIENLGRALKHAGEIMGGGHVDEAEVYNPEEVMEDNFPREGELQDAHSTDASDALESNRPTGSNPRSRKPGRSGNRRRLPKTQSAQEPLPDTIIPETKGDTPKVYKVKPKSPLHDKIETNVFDDAFLQKVSEMDGGDSITAIRDAYYNSIEQEMVFDKAYIDKILRRLTTRRELINRNLIVGDIGEINALIDIIQDEIDQLS